MTVKPTNQIDNLGKTALHNELQIRVVSFGYKKGPPPPANILFDVRFLKNPYWVEELRPLTGRDKPVQDYVLQQELAQDFLQSMLNLLEKILPKMAEMKVKEFVIALGCTGGQHRSATLVETLVKQMHERFPQFKIVCEHRELCPSTTEAAEADEEE